jgi:hypothetical protein
VVLEVCYVVLFSSRLYFNVFPVPPIKSKLIGDVLRIGKMRQLRTCFFSLLQRALPIDAPNHPALLGDALRPQKKSAKLNLEIIAAANSDRVAYWPCNLSPLHSKQIQNGGEQFAAFFLFMGTSPIDSALLGGNGNTLKLKTTAKFYSKQTLIATV